MSRQQILLNRYVLDWIIFIMKELFTEILNQRISLCIW